MSDAKTAVDQDQARFEATLRKVVAGEIAAARQLFQAGQPILVARAPGRLDVMGGIADYSGSLVLQWPIREATLAAAQVNASGKLAIVSLASTPGESDRGFELDLALFRKWQHEGYIAAHDYFAALPAQHWAAYVAGVVLALARERHLPAFSGLSILVDSRVPEGKGVSSSAALEVGVIRAVAEALEVSHLGGAEAARICQLAENYVVDAPCGIMDQMTSALGQANHLLSLRCQPAEVRGHLRLPRNLAFWGIDSGIRHAVTGSDYASVRAGAFMGYRILADHVGLGTRAGTSGDTLVIADPRWQGYLANVGVAELDGALGSVLPETLTGAEFLARHGGTTDPVTRVERGTLYAIRQPASHPIREHQRVRRFGEWLMCEPEEADLRLMGQLMYDSHASYSACGLGSDGTDRLVAMVREAGPSNGLYGAKITGGGSGGTVAIMARAEAGAVVAEIARRYGDETGRESYVFEGSSPGAFHTAVARVVV